MELWLIYAILAAFFAALVTIFTKIGVDGVESNLATAIRTVVVIIFAFIMVAVSGAGSEISYISGVTWVFLIFSGLATGGAWLSRMRALKLGNVNKVTPIDKSSTILTMLLAFIILGEPLGWLTALGMVLMGAGTWLMIEWKSDAKKGERGWLVFAVLSAVFAAAVAILGRAGVTDMDATLWTAARMIIVVPLAWLFVFAKGSHKTIRKINKKSWLFLILSGIATGASWLFFYHALKLGNASQVVPIDKLSILLTMLFAAVFLKERFTAKSLVGLGLLTIGTLIPIIL